MTRPGEQTIDLDPTDLLSAHSRGQVRVASAAALIGAAQTGLLDAIAAEPRDPVALAAALGLHPDAVARVLVLLAAIGVVERHPDGRFGPSLELLAEVHGPGGGADAAVRLWSQLPEYLRTGVSELERMAVPAPRATAYAQAVAGLGRLFERLSQAIAAALGPVPGGGRVLDVGAGSGQWSLAMAARQEQVHVTALDLGPVLPRFGERAAALGLGGRVATLAGDYHRVELPPAGFDRIVAANVLHLETESAAARLVERLASALAPAGQLVIIDALPSGDPVPSPAIAAYALSLGLRTGEGRPHAEPLLRGWLAAAGLPRCERVAARLGSEQALVGALMATRAPT